MFNNNIYSMRIIIETLKLAIQNFLTKVLKTHSTRLRSASQSLLVRILLKCDFEEENFLTSLSNMNFLEPSSTSYCFEEIKKLEWSKKEIIIENKPSTDSEIHRIVLQSILSGSELDQSKFSAIFDSASLDTFPKTISAIRLLAKYFEYSQTDLKFTRWEIGQNLVVSFLEFLFLVLSSGQRLNNENFISNTNHVITVTKWFLTLLPDQLKKLSCKKLSEIIIGRLKTDIDDQTVPLLLKIFKMLPEDEKCGKIGKELIENGILNKWLKYQSDEIITATWSILDRVPKIPIENLVTAACEAIERCSFKGQIKIMAVVTKYYSGPVSDGLKILVRSSWDAVRNSFHTRFAAEVYETFCSLTMLLLENSDNSPMISIFEKVLEKSKTRHGMLLPFYRNYFSAVKRLKNVSFDSKILEAALLAGTGFNRDITTEVTAVTFAQKLQKSSFIDIVNENKFYIDVTNEMNDVRLLAINFVTEQKNITEIIKILIKLTERESKKHPRYHPESATHKLKERAWQTIVFLLKKNETSNQITPDEITDLYKNFLKNINADEQNSVLSLQQLAIVLCLEKNNNLWKRLMVKN